MIGWQNMKHNSAFLLNTPDAKSIPGNSRVPYLTAILDTCNWGYALAEAMLELAENYRKSMLIKSLQEIKEAHYAELNAMLDELTGKNEENGQIISRMAEMQYDMRFDANNLLADFCDLYYYERQNDDCSFAEPTYDGELSDVIGSLDQALGTSIWNSQSPRGSMKRVEITDEDTSSDCEDAEVCPIRVFRNTGQLRYTVPINHPEFSNVNTYRVGSMRVIFDGAKPSGQTTLAMDIESGGQFSMSKGSDKYDFITRAMLMTHSYNVNTGALVTETDLYKPQSAEPIIFHRSPFTTWTVTVQSYSSSIDLSGVTKATMVFCGSGTQCSPTCNDNMEAGEEENYNECTMF